LAGALDAALAGTFAAVFVGAFAGRAGVFVAFTALVVPRERAAVLGGGAEVVRLAVVVVVALVAAVRRPVVVLVLREVLVAFAVALGAAALRVVLRVGCFEVDRVALGMAGHPSRG
jgi:hypothetical protein